MCRAWNVPVLLIEFDSQRPFELQNREYFGGEISVASISSKLTLLVLHFPKLRLVWSRGAHATASIFADLKRGNAQPELAGCNDISEAASVLVPRDVLRRMPGVSDRNFRKLTNAAPTLGALSSMSRSALQDAAGKREGSKLHSFFAASTTAGP